MSCFSTLLLKWIRLECSLALVMVIKAALSNWTGNREDKDLELCNAMVSWSYGFIEGDTIWLEHEMESYNITLYWGYATIHSLFILQSCAFAGSEIRTEQGFLSFLFFSF